MQTDRIGPSYASYISTATANPSSLVEGLEKPDIEEPGIKTFAVYLAGSQMLKALKIFQNAFCFKHKNVLKIHESLNSVFNWDIDELIERRHHNMVWLNVLQWRESIDSLEANKTLIDMSELGKYIKRVIDEYILNGEYSACMDIVKPAYDYSVFYDEILVSRKRGSIIEAELFRQVVSGRFLSNIVNSRFKRKVGMDVVLNNNIIEPIVNRFKLAHQKVMESQHECYHQRELDRLENAIREAKKNYDEHEYISHCTCNVYYNESEFYRKRILIMEQQHRKAFDDLEDKKLILKNAIAQLESDWKMAIEQREEMNQELKEQLLKNKQEEEEKAQLALELALAEEQLKKKKRKLHKKKSKTSTEASSK